MGSIIQSLSCNVAVNIVYLKTKKPKFVASGCISNRFLVLINVWSLVIGMLKNSQDKQSHQHTLYEDA